MLNWFNHSNHFGKYIMICFLVRVSDEIIQLNTIVNETNCDVVAQNSFMPLWYTIRSPHGSDALALSHYFFESGKVDAVDVGFVYFKNN
jgi:hypothetical protein